jgi:alpha-glucoside transport system substrate-binding protein
VRGLGPVSLGVATVIAIASGATGCGRTETVGSVTVLGGWTNAEAAEFETVLDLFEDETEIRVEYTGTRDSANVLASMVDSGNPPDIAVLSDPYLLRRYAAHDTILPLDGVVDGHRLAVDYPAQWLDLMRMDTSSVRAVVVKATLKSLVWYSPAAFAAGSYRVPRTWTELTALSRQATDSGVAPWCLGLESTPASGWPGTDWIEDIVLHESGTTVYQEWAGGDISWTSPEIRGAWRRWGEIVARPGSVYGGATAALLTNFAEAGTPLFAAPPGCLLDHEASFVMGSYATKRISGGRTALPGLDFAAFPFPQIDPRYANAQTSPRCSGPRRSRGS